MTEAQQVLPSVGETPQGRGRASFAIPEEKCLTRSKLKDEGSSWFRIQGGTAHGGRAGTEAGCGENRHFVFTVRMQRTAKNCSQAEKLQGPLPGNTSACSSPARDHVFKHEYMGPFHIQTTAGVVWPGVRTVVEDNEEGPPRGRAELKQNRSWKLVFK